LENQKAIESEELDPWSLFIYAMKAPMTKDRYKTRVVKFFDFIGIDKNQTIEAKARIFATRGKEDINWAFSNVLKFIHFQKERVDKKEITGATVRNYAKSIKLFCEMADIPIPWKKITRGLPRGKKYADDRIPTLEEIRKLVEYPDRRIKAIVYTMASSGIRVGAWDYLQWGHIRPLEGDGEVIAAKIIVYAGEDDEYFTFISHEALRALQEWMGYRQSSGEPISENSWVMRDLWDTRVAHGRGLARLPKKLSSLGLKRLMERAIWAQGLRKKLEPGKKRHPYQANHSLRKWFKTRCEIAGMKPINIEKLMNHSVGVSDSYYRATENELLEDYLKAIDLLAINGDQTVLQKQVKALKERNEDSEYFVKAKLQEKDDQLRTMQDQFTQLQSQVQVLISSIGNIDQASKNNLAKKMYESGIYRQKTNDT
jgi:integrase